MRGSSRAFTVAGMPQTGRIRWKALAAPIAVVACLVIVLGIWEISRNRQALPETHSPLRGMNSSRFSSKYQGNPSPPTREELGQSTWLLLHKMASTFPKEPSQEQRDDMKAFIHILSRHYPCDECAAHFRCVRFVIHCRRSLPQ